VSRRSLILIFFAATLFPRPATAEWIVSPYVGVRFASDTTFLGSLEAAERNRFTFGSSVGLLTDGVLGVEADVSFVPGYFELLDRRGTVVAVMGNVIAATPLRVARYGLRPYIVGGLGMLYARAGSVRLDIENSRLFGMNIGGGAIGPLSPRSSVRFDLRYFRNLSHDEAARDPIAGDPADLSYWRATVGLTFRF
jgi:hypothetical protein